MRKKGRQVGGEGWARRCYFGSGGWCRGRGERPRCSRARPGRGGSRGLPGPSTGPSAAGGCPRGLEERGMGPGVCGNPDLSAAARGSSKMERTRQRPACRLLYRAVIKLCAADSFSRLFGYLRLMVFLPTRQTCFKFPFFSVSLISSQCSLPGQGSLGVSCGAGLSVPNTVPIAVFLSWAVLLPCWP